MDKITELCIEQVKWQWQERPVEAIWTVILLVLGIIGLCKLFGWMFDNER